MSRSGVKIDNAVFESNYFHTLLNFFSKVKIEISKCNFTWNKAILISHESFKALLEISSCRFEGNMQNENSLINIDTGFTGFIKFQDTNFLNKLDRDTEIPIIHLKMATASFENCTAINNHGGSIQFLIFDQASANISNCKLSGYQFGHFESSNISIENTLFEKGLTIRVFRSSIIVIKTSTFIENKSFGSYGGAIYLSEKSQMTSVNCTFSGNRAIMEGGAIVITDSSTYHDSGSLFFNNTAPNSGKSQKLFFDQYSKGYFANHTFYK